MLSKELILLIALLTSLSYWPSQVLSQGHTHAFSSYEFYDTFPARSQVPEKRIISSTPTPTATGAFQLKITTTPASCASGNGMITVNPSGGVSPYSYSFDGGSWQRSGYHSASGGTHTVDVRDVTGATVSATVNVPNNGKAPTATITNIKKPSGCTSKDASLTLKASGGTPPYSYSLAGESWQRSPTFSNLTSGYYGLFVVDAKGCIYGTSYTFYGCVSLTTSGTNATCNNNNGTITVEAHDAYPPYTYSLDGINYQGSGKFTGLSAGVYTSSCRIWVAEVSAEVWALTVE